MIQKKDMIQAGGVAQDIVVVVEHDRNGKAHFIAFESMDDAKRFSTSADKRIVKLWKMQEKS